MKRRAARVGISLKELIERDKFVKEMKATKKKYVKKLYKEDFEEFDKLPLVEKIKHWYNPLQSTRFNNDRTKKDYVSLTRPCEATSR